MAYRFTPPPNWPIDDANWSPPPGWQPDPSWGPAPEGWNFWVEAEDAGSGADATGGGVPADDVPADTTDAETAPAAEPEAVPETVLSGAEPATAPGADGAEQPSAEEAAPETDEYPGPDLAADLAQAAPYESAVPAAPETGEASASEPIQYGSPTPYGSPAAYGSPAPAGDYGQQHQGYGTGSAAPGYPASPGYGPTSANAMPGGQSTDPAWTAATGADGTPPKSVVARFWWVGCIVLVLVAALIIAIAGGIYLFSSSDDNAQGDGGTTTQAQPTTDEETTTEEETPEEEAAPSPEPTTPLPTIDESAKAQDIIDENGSGSLAVHMEWKKAADLPSSYGGTVEEPKNGEYLVVTAELTVTEGQMAFPSYYFNVVTPYGGTVDESSESYGLADSGRDYDSSYEFTEGETYTIVLLYDFVRAGGNVLNYDNYVDVYTWDVPA